MLLNKSKRHIFQHTTIATTTYCFASKKTSLLVRHMRPMHAFQLSCIRSPTGVLHECVAFETSNQTYSA